MKKIRYALLLPVLMFLAGCFEIVQETTINEQGGGVFVNTTDMSAMMGMIKMMGDDAAKEMGKEKKDTTISLAGMKDSIQNLSDKEKELLEKATLKVVLSGEAEKFYLTFSFPYTQPEDLAIINGILNKTKEKTLSKQMESLMPSDGKDMEIAAGGNENKDGMPELDNYFDVTTENGKLTRKLNKEKYALAQSDKSLQGLQEMGQMGAPMTMKTIFNLPRPAKNVTGKGVKLSEDKKKVTIEATLDDFFDSPEKFEYLIEY